MQKNALPAGALCEGMALCGWPARGGNRYVTKTLLVMTPSEARRHRTNRKSIVLAMKLTIFLLTVALLNVSASGLSQNITFSARNISLQKVFKEVRKQTGFVFMYEESYLKDTKE